MIRAVAKNSKTLVLPVLNWRRAGGIEAITMDIASAFVAMGWRVKVFSVFDPTTLEDVPGVEAISLYPSSRLNRLLWCRYLWRPVLAKRIREALTEGDLLLFGHAHLLPIIDRLSPLPDVLRWIWVYGLDVWGGEARRWLSRLNRLDRVISISDFTADQIIGAGLKTPIDVVPCCVDIREFTPAANPELIRRSEILICGRMDARERYKGHDLLLECLPIAEGLTGKSLTLRIVGTGDDLNRLRAKAQQLGLDKKVIFTGRASFSELVEAYRHCGVFCMPSRLERRDQGYWSGEGFGIVYIEAAACGRPVIASTDGGAPETVIPEKTGLVVDPRSPKAVARAIADIIHDPFRADAMGRNGRSMVEKKFSRETFFRTVKELVSRDVSL